MKFIRATYLNDRFFLSIIGLVLVFILGFIYPIFTIFGKFLFVALLAITVTDLYMLFAKKNGLRGRRLAPNKLSNGDENQIQIFVENFYQHGVNVSVIDEVPHQFQLRNVDFRAELKQGEVKVIDYSLRPVKRGEYEFGAVNVYASTVIGLVSRKFIFSQDEMVPVYPSFLQMRKYELHAISQQLVDLGIKKIRKIGHNMEFEQIKEYVPGDDYRTINWKATARKSSLMVNSYQDERSQQVYSVIDKGRVMKMPFNGMTLLDYAINAALVISNIAIRKEDRAGIITFQNKIGAILPASRRNKQMHLIMELLFNQKTAYRESDFSLLYTAIKQRITQRSLLLLYTNFESNASLERQLPYLRKLAKSHLLVVIFFENTELEAVIHNHVNNVKQVYHKIIAEKFINDKRLIVKELAQFGIHSILTKPENLTVDTINKYLELKARGLI